MTYLDTGTWTGLYIEERPDLQGRAFRPFLRFSPGGGRDEYAHEHRRWNDDPGAPGPTEILGPVRRTGWGGEEPVQPSEPRPARWETRSARWGREPSAQCPVPGAWS